MAGVDFETAIGAIFARCETAIAARVDQARTKAEALQSQDTSRLAYTLTEAIEHAVEPAIDEALETYDGAINRPITPDKRYEEVVRRRIELTVDAGVELALKLDAERHPWKPLLTQETPKLRERLLARDDLRKHKKSRRRRPAGLPEMMVRLGSFLGGLVVGGLAMHLIGH
jgi:hypothetical protein